jgi:ABC-type uncharacterized transport system substrate-binding protein
MRQPAIAVRHATEGGSPVHKPVLGSMVLVVLLVSSALLSGDACAAERARPIRIGALTDSWGPTPEIVGLRDGLLALGYREPEQFVLGVRFTQGDQTALPAAALQLVQYGVALIFADSISAAKTAQMTTTRIPIVLAGMGRQSRGDGTDREFRPALR